MNMKEPDILCIGSVLWDVIGRAEADMPYGADMPGRIRRVLGGVAMNIALTLQALGRRPALLTVIGCDAEGVELDAELARRGIDARFLLRSPDLPTDRYMAIECPAGLVAALADAHSLEAAGDAILAPLLDGRLGRETAPWDGFVALDGNLTEALLAEIAENPLLGKADLRVAPASPGKATRLLKLRPHPRASYYLNLEEAGLMAGCSFDNSADAARALVAGGLARVVVTNGAAETADADAQDCLTALPPQVEVRQVTGAGDSFMAAHVAAEMTGAGRAEALSRALDRAAAHISGDHS